MTKARMDGGKKNQRAVDVKASRKGKSPVAKTKAAQAGSRATPKEIAEWMIAQIDEDEQLLQVEAVAAIKKIGPSDFGVGV